jgi:hypothetical protein
LEAADCTCLVENVLFLLAQQHLILSSIETAFLPSTTLATLISRKQQGFRQHVYVSFPIFFLSSSKEVRKISPAAYFL